MKKRVVHIIFWIVYITFWAIVTKEQESLALNVLVNLCFSVFHLATAYAFYGYLVPRFLTQKKVAAFLLLGLVCLGINALLLFGTLHLFFRGPLSPDFFLAENIIPAIAFSLLITSIIFILWKIFEKQQLTEAAKLRAEKNALALELALLKNQINPHFLLNSLNNIYFLIQQKPTLAAEALLKFSEILKLQLYEFQTDKILINKEVAYLENYIEIQKLRVDENVEVLFEKEIRNETLEIAPLLLIVLVENAFKHIPRYQIDEPILIKMKLTTSHQKLIFYCENTIDTEQSPSQNGIGLDNLTKRLHYLFPQKHELNNWIQNNKYHAKLIIECN